MKIVVGQYVSGDDFWDRKYEIEDIWDAIESNSHVLISAPRRVGKTSIMHNIKDNPKENYIAIYLNTESADREYDFWHKLFNHINDEEFVNKLESFSKNTWKKIKSIKIKKITATGVEFGDGSELDYKEAFITLIKDLESDKKIIIMIDEFAQTIENIIKYESEEKAINLLKTNRELRQDEKLNSKVTFIYAGSIGLESVVSKINASKHINDLNNIKVSPLEFDEGKEFIKKLAINNNIEIDDDSIEYILNKVEWLIPFYIQLIMQELKKLFRRKSFINSEIIDEAIEKILEQNNYFDNWVNKLKIAFEKNSYLFAKELLNNISENSVIEKNQVINLATKYKLDTNDINEIIHSLKYDGYINNNDEKNIYRFNSPILKMWWYENVAS